MHTSSVEAVEVVPKNSVFVWNSRIFSLEISFVKPNLHAEWKYPVEVLTLLQNPLLR